MPQQVIIEFIPELSRLKSAEERLQELGRIDQRSATIFKATNDQLSQREKITKQITVSTTKEQDVVNKLVSSLKTLSGESKRAVEGLLRLSTDEIVEGFNSAGLSVDEYVSKLRQLSKDQGGSALTQQLQTEEALRGKLTASVTREQMEVNKLVSAMKTLTGESLSSVKALLKLPTDEIVNGFQSVGMSIDEYIAKLHEIDGQPIPDPVKGVEQSFQKAQDGATDFSNSLKKVKAEGASVKPTVEALRISIEKLKAQVAAKKNLLVTETDITKINQYNREIEQLENEIKRLSNAGKEGFDEFGNSLQRNEQSSVRLRLQLRKQIEEMQRLKVAGLDNTEAYAKLRAEVARLTDDLGDVSAEVKALASDTSALDGMIGAVQGLAGGFAVAQGAAALFGDESEEMQEVLLKVNAAMAILQGLQQIQALRQKESAVSLLMLNFQRKVGNVQLALENGLQSRSIVVRGAATVAQKALNAAMAANPIGLVITALVTVIGLFALYARNAKQAAREQAALNAALRESTEGLDAEVTGLKAANDRRIAELTAAGAKQSDILRQQAKGEQAIAQARLNEIQRLNNVIQENRNATNEDSLAALRAAEERKTELIKESEEARNDIEIRNIEGRKQMQLEAAEAAVSIREAEVARIAALGNVNTDADFNARRNLLRAQSALEVLNAGQNSARILAIRQKLNNDLHQLDLEQIERNQKQTIAALESTLVEAQKRSKDINERTSQEEIDIQKKIILTRARFESQQEGLGQKERTAILAKGMQEAAELQRSFNQQTVIETLQDQISLNNQQLAQTQIAEDQKLDLRIENIILAAAAEEEANRGLTAKIKEINAQRDADIKAARLQSIQETLDFELRRSAVAFAAQSREIDRQLSGQDALRSVSTQRQRRLLAEMLGIRQLSLAQEKALIDEQTRHELSAVDTRVEALKKSHNLIPLREYNQRYAELQDEQQQILERAEARKRDASLKTFEYQKRLDAERVQFAINVAGELVNVLAGVSDVQSAKADNYIASQRAKLEELKEAGAITEREEILRIKKIDAEERKYRHAQAVREKQQALFNAVISTAAAVAKANPVVPLMVLAGAAGAAQIAIIASKPIPKFAKGKSKYNTYEGPGIMGEAGAELLERNGRMYVAAKPTLVWVGKTDRIHTHKETRKILERAIPQVNNKVVVQPQKPGNTTIDYEKLGKAIGKHTSTTLNIDGYRQFIKEKESFTEYLNSRRGF